ncbi:MAG: lytic murein transglycosylase B [Nevskiales bacterium]|nr:lytic murein transglycosylase B [Nevskiales bacterium]
MIRKGLGLALVVACSTAAADYSAHPKAGELLETLRSKYAFDVEALQATREALIDAKRVDKLIKQERNAPERTWTWFDYRPIHVNPKNIANGQAFVRQHQARFDAAEARWGVPGAVVAAIMGAETKYGGYTGPHRILDSLATQGFDHPTRTPFFFNELVEFFVLCRELGMDPRAPKGSYAGAMGLSQFMPSNYRRLAVDFDNSGHVDLWDVDDAIGSTANYLVHYRGAGKGWQRGEPVAVPAQLTEPMPQWAKTNTKFPSSTVGELTRLGFRPSIPLDDDMPAGIIALEIEPGRTAYWIGLQNFYALMSYNPRTFYAMSVFELSEAIASHDSP